MSDGRKVIRQIVDITNKSYVLNGEGFNAFYFNDLENDYHVWTIEDAKDGDVLAIGNVICIFKKMDTAGLSIFWTHCEIIGNSEFGLGFSFSSNTIINPATKEQRDLLFQKMKEAGYKWDSDKKELKKIEDNSAWSEEDDIFLKAIIRDIENVPYINEKAKKDRIAWLRSLKDRVQPRQEWSEEDDKTIDETIELIEEVEKQYQMPNGFTDLIIKLKSLRPQNNWRPTDEQIEMLENVRKILHTKDIYSKTNNLMYNFEELIRTLKKIKD
jgi:hypothetical protein